ncbi:MAG: dethiobiotin synthase [Thaumarchaeota archaeon]|nr:dethiobiotin synthase [Nitrososphaerota archaeon]
MKSYFITATDTGVGKTTITAALAVSIKKSGIDVGIMKPVATGVLQKTGFRSSDVSVLHHATKVNDPENEVNPIFMPLPVSPYDASKILDLKFDKKIIFEQFAKLKNKHKMMLVEGIGGILTPLTRDYFVADLIKDLGLETIVVTRSTLGTLNHTMMTIKTCRDYKIPVKGILVNNYDENGGPAEKNAPTTIHEITGVPILGVIPFIRDYENLEEMVSCVEKNVDLKSLIS